MSDSRSSHYVKSFGRNPNLGEIHVYDNGLWDEDQECPSLSITASMDCGSESTMAAIIEGDELYELHRVISEAILRFEGKAASEEGASGSGAFRSTLSSVHPIPAGPIGYMPWREADLEDWTQVTWFAKKDTSKGFPVLFAEAYVEVPDV